MKKILIIGSARSFVDNRRGLFRRGNFEIVTAPTADKGLDMLKDGGADLVITDLNDRSIPGDELCARIPKETGKRNIRVIVLCSARERDMERCKACGASDYIAGAVTTDELFEKTARLLGVSRRRSYRVLARISVEGELGEFGDIPFFGTMKDLSTTGTLLEAGKTLTVGERIRCSFFLGDTNIRVTGEVMRVVDDLCGHLYGVRFLEMDAEHEAAIAEFVNTKRSDSNL